MNTKRCLAFIGCRTKYYTSKKGSKTEAKSLASWHRHAFLVAQRAKTIEEVEQVYLLSPSGSRGQRLAWKKMQTLFFKKTEVSENIPKRVPRLILVFY